jgi:hypothetical protein
MTNLLRKLWQVDVMVWALLLVIGGIFTTFNPHPRTTRQNFLFAGTYLALVLVGTAIIARYVPRRPILRPVIYACRNNGDIAVASKKDYELGCAIEDRYAILEQNERPEAPLIGYFYGTESDIPTGNLSDFERLARQCQVRWVDMRVGKPGDGRTVNLVTLYRLIFDETASEVLKRAEAMKL